MREIKSPVSRIASRLSGNAAAELPIALWIILFVLIFPLLNLSTIGLRIPFMYWAVHNGCILGAKARSFQVPLNGQPSAVQLAQHGVDRVLQSFSGIHAHPVATNIVITDIKTHSKTLVPGPLADAADVNSYTYQLQVTVGASVDPIIVCPFPISVPGLTEPINLTFSDRQFVENPAGLSI